MRVEVGVPFLAPFVNAATSENAVKNPSDLYAIADTRLIAFRTPAPAPIPETSVPYGVDRFAPGAFEWQEPSLGSDYEPRADPEPTQSRPASGRTEHRLL